MTSGPGAIAALLLVAMSVLVLSRAVHGRLPGRSMPFLAAALCVVAVALAARNVTVNHVIPNWLEYTLVRNELRRHVEAGRDISHVTIYLRSSLLGEARDEFHWANFDGAFWAHWAIRNVLDELGANSVIRIDVVNRDGSRSTTNESLFAAELTPPNSGTEVTVDLRAIDLAAPPRGTLRQPEPFFSLVLGGGGLPDSLPEGLTIASASEIHSTLTFADLGASGERAAIDGDPATAAADPRGVNSETSIELRLESIQDVAGLRVLTARQYGVAIPVAMRISCNAEETWRVIGKIDIKAGTDVASQALFESPCRSSTIRLAPSGAPTATNFWLAEVQVLVRRPN